MYHVTHRPSGCQNTRVVLRTPKNKNKTKQNPNNNEKLVLKFRVDSHLSLVSGITLNILVSQLLTAAFFPFNTDQSLLVQSDRLLSWDSCHILLSIYSRFRR